MSWNAIDDVDILITAKMKNIHSRKDYIVQPSDTKAQLDDILQEKVRNEVKFEEINAEAKLHRLGGCFREIQRPDNLEGKTQFMEDITLKKAERSNQLNSRREELSVIRKKLKISKSALENELKAAYNDLQREFKTKEFAI